MNFVKADRNQASEWALPSRFGLPSRGERVARTLDEVGLRAAANVLVALDLVASVGAAGAVVFDCVLLLEARVSGCAARAPRRPHAAQYSADRACRRSRRSRRSRRRDSGRPPRPFPCLPSTTQAARRSVLSRPRVPAASKRVQAEQAARLRNRDRLRNQGRLRVACKQDQAHCARTCWDEQQQHAEQEQRQLHECGGGRRHQELAARRCFPCLGGLLVALPTSHYLTTIMLVVLLPR